MREIVLRVRFAETDAMGVVWHGNYFQYLEMGRIEWLRSVGWLNSRTEKMRMAAVHTSIDYHHPARFDDWLTVRTTLAEASSVRFKFRHEILCQEEVVVTGTFDLVCLDGQGRVCRIPEDLIFLEDV